MKTQRLFYKHINYFIYKAMLQKQKKAKKKITIARWRMSPGLVLNHGSINRYMFVLSFLKL